MPDPTVTTFDVVRHNLFAKTTVNAYDGTLKNVVRTFTSGALIGTIYSWIERPDGIYFMFYGSDADYNNFNPFYVKLTSGALDLPDLPGILDAKIKAQIQKEKDDKGLIAYYIEKYAPWLIGAAVVSIALPTVVKVTKSKRGTTVNGMMKKNTAEVIALLLLGGVAVAAIAAKPKKKRKGSIIIDPLDEGEFLTDAEYELYYGD